MTEERWEESPAHSQDEASAVDERPMPAPALISLVYESRDKKLCLFEDASGHLTAVRASRLA